MCNSESEIFINTVVESTSENLIILESQLPNHPSSSKTYIAAGAKRWISARGDVITEEKNGNSLTYRLNPWDALKKFKNHKKSWLFGYLGYDLKNHIEKLSSSNKQLIDAPDMFFMEPETVIEIEKGRVVFCAGKQSFKALKKDGKESLPQKFAMTCKPFIKKADYLNTVQDIQHRIQEGDFYELNYTYPLTGSFSGDTFELFRRMRAVNPVPFGAYLRLDNITVACASPERFLKRKGSVILSEPIKGTAKRSGNPETDALLKKDLMNEKNRAENLMIVDLVRHDMSKFAVKDSVKVPKLYDLQSFETIHQLISSVTCQVEESLDSVDIIRSCFPMGSMTGAPKIEVMKNIDEFEDYRRGLYSGAIGYMKPNGDFDFNVVIRSAIIQNGTLVFPVGGAITSDSNPHAEWEETLVKAATLTTVLSKNKIT